MNLTEQLKDLGGQFEVVRTYYDRLTERERYILIGCVSAAAIVVLLSVYLFFLDSLSGMEGKIQKSRDNLRMLQTQKEVYEQTEGHIRQLENLIRATEPGFQLATHLERLARENGVNIDVLKNIPAPPNDLYRETQVSITVRQVTLRTLIDFLYEIENSQALLRISSLKVKPNFQDPTQLNVSFVVSNFQPSNT